MAVLLQMMVVLLQMTTRITASADLPLEEKEGMITEEPRPEKLWQVKKTSGLYNSCYGIHNNLPDAKKQVTRSHNIVADGWAGASNPHPHPMSPHQHTYP